LIDNEATLEDKKEVSPKEQETSTKQNPNLNIQKYQTRNAAFYCEAEPSRRCRGNLRHVIKLPIVQLPYLDTMRISRSVILANARIYRLLGELQPAPTALRAGVAQNTFFAPRLHQAIHF
jgi:hypothetical protein